MVQIGVSSAKAVLLVAITVAAGACSNLQPPDANGPRANVRPYPIVVADDETAPAVRLAWQNLSKARGTATSAEPGFNPLTGTLESLPANGATQVILPKVGSGPTQTEEEMRESLRRFINDWRELIGAEPAQLSLIERVDEPSGIKLARYEQRPFRLQMRGGFGRLLIRFRSSDRQVIEISSNCIPNTDRLQASLAALSPKVSAEEATAHLTGRAFTVTEANGRTQSFTVPSGTPLEVQQLVVYALPSSDKMSLELHLAWEIMAPNGAIKTIYLDAINDEVIAAG